MLNESGDLQAGEREAEAKSRMLTSLLEEPAHNQDSILEDLLIEEKTSRIITFIRAAKKASGGHASLATRLVRSSGIYALASFVSPLVSLVLSPFLTRYLSRAEFGAFAILMTAISLIAGITQLGLGSAFFRVYSYDYESQRDRRVVLSTTVILLLFVSAPVTAIIMLTASGLASLLFDISSLGDGVKSAALVVLMQNLTIPGFSWLRAEERVLSFSVLSIINSLIYLGLTFVLVGLRHIGLVGALVAMGGGYAAVVICTLPMIFWKAGLQLRVDIIRGLLSFGVPNVASFVSVWFLQLSDRYLLGRLTSLSQAASYAVAYTLGSVLSTIVITPFTLAWYPAIYAIARREDAAQVFGLVFRWFFILLLIAAFGLSLLGTLLLNVAFPPAYHSAAPIIPIITLSIFLYGIYIMFTTGISVRRKPWLVAVFMALSALVNIGINLILIPLYGAMGAAFATLLAYALLTVIACIVNQHIYPIPFELGLFCVALLIGVGLYGGASFLAQLAPGAGRAWIIFASAFVIYGGCLGALGMFASRAGRSRGQYILKGILS